MGRQTTINLPHGTSKGRRRGVQGVPRLPNFYRTIAFRGAQLED